MTYEHKTEFLDLETSGLPLEMVPGKKPGTMKKRYFDYKTEYMRFPFIVSMAWARNDGDIVYHVINPEGREIPKEASDIHGITTEIANKSDLCFADMEVIGSFIKDALDSKIIVGHGLYFDTSTIKANMLREIDLGHLDKYVYEDAIIALHKHKRIDTMRSTANMCRKWPTLSEIHQKLFRKGFDAHNAKSDVEATRRVYEFLLKKGIVPTHSELMEKAKEKEISS